MTRLPPSSLNFTHIRSISPQSSLPTVPTASAPSSSPRFLGFLIASSTLLEKSSAEFIELLQMVARHLRVHFHAPCVDPPCHTARVRKTVSHKKGRGIKT